MSFATGSLLGKEYTPLTNSSPRLFLSLNRPLNMSAALFPTLHHLHNCYEQASYTWELLTALVNMSLWRKIPDRKDMSRFIVSSGSILEVLKTKQD